MLTISEIMTREVFTVDAWAKADEAAWALTSRNITGAPVRDSLGRVVGTLSRSELAGADLRGRSARVKDLMRDDLWVCRDSDSALEAVRLMVLEQLHHLIVVDEAGDVVGLVTPMDVLKAIAHGEEFEAASAFLEQRPIRSEPLRPGA